MWSSVLPAIHLTYLLPSLVRPSPSSNHISFRLPQFHHRYPFITFLCSILSFLLPSFLVHPLLRPSSQFLWNEAVLPVSQYPNDIEDPKGLLYSLRKILPSLNGRISKILTKLSLFIYFFLILFPDWTKHSPPPMTLVLHSTWMCPW